MLASEPSFLRTKRKSLTPKGFVICGSSSSAQLREMMLWRGEALGSEHATEHSLLKGLESFSPNAAEPAMIRCDSACQYFYAPCN